VTSKRAATKAAPKKTVRVIALQAYNDHPYGHEFEHEPGAKLDKLIADKVVRIDDRWPPPGGPNAPKAPVAAEEPET